jgi:hypothetical protein
MTSMLMVEAALLNRPTLAILPREEEILWLPTAAAGITPVATTRLEVERKLADLLAELRAPDLKALSRLFPPHALDRVAATVERLMSG